jgi:hypothetical protein
MRVELVILEVDAVFYQSLTLHKLEADARNVFLSLLKLLHLTVQQNLSANYRDRGHFAIFQVLV